MKKLGIVFVFLFSVSLAFTQTEIDTKLLEAYGEEYASRIKSSNPGLVSFLKVYCEKGMQVIPVNQKPESFEAIERIPLLSKDTSTISIDQFLIEYESEKFNPLNYGFLPKKEVQVYRLMGTSKMLVIASQRMLLEN